MSQMKKQFNKVNLDSLKIKKSYPKNTLTKDDFLFTEEKTEYISYVPKNVRDEIEKKDSIIKELKEELEDLKKEIEMLKNLNEEY